MHQHLHVKGAKGVKGVKADAATTHPDISRPSQWMSRDSTMGSDGTSGELGACWYQSAKDTKDTS